MLLSSLLWSSLLLAHCINIHGITEHVQHKWSEQLHMLPFSHQLLSKKVVKRYLFIFISDIVKLYFRVKRIISESKCLTIKGQLISDNLRFTEKNIVLIIVVFTMVIFVISSLHQHAWYYWACATHVVGTAAHCTCSHYLISSCLRRWSSDIYLYLLVTLWNFTSEWKGLFQSQNVRQIKGCLFQII